MRSAHSLPSSQRGILPLSRAGGDVLGPAARRCAVVASLGLLGLLWLTQVHLGTYDAALFLRLPEVQQAQQPGKGEPVAPSHSATTKISEQLTRISQLDPKQYANRAEYDTYATSACSTTSMTEVLNAWWGYARYTISDVLRQELAAKAISADLGLLDSGGIARTMRRFGFDTTTPTLSLDQVIATANRGLPVIVGWPPETWQGGHLLVVVGGDASEVKLADSSQFNFTSLSRPTFLARWRGFAAVSTPSPYSLLGKPTLSAARINQILAAYHSPMQGQGQAIYDITTHFGIDTTIALGFYLHESTMGTAGMAVLTHSWGNLRCVPDAECRNQQGGACQAGQSCYASFPDGVAGLTRWCKLMTSNVYALSGLVLVDDIIGRYAPSADHNDEAAYRAALKHAADTWRAGTIIVS